MRRRLGLNAGREVGASDLKIVRVFAIIAETFYAGEAGGMKLRKLASLIAVFAALASVWLDGCGGSSANMVTVAHEPAVGGAWSSLRCSILAPPSQAPRT